MFPPPRRVEHVLVPAGLDIDDVVLPQDIIQALRQRLLQVILTVITNHYLHSFFLNSGFFHYKLYRIMEYLNKRLPNAIAPNSHKLHETTIGADHNRLPF